MIANSCISDNSFLPVQNIVANGYYMDMRGDAKRKTRLKNLRLLKKQYTWEEIAEICGLSAPYLSQIANEVTQAKGKKPRGLSDNYAEKIESGLRLEPGWLDIPYYENSADGLQIPATSTKSYLKKSTDGIAESQTTIPVKFSIDPTRLATAIGELDKELPGWQELPAMRRSRLIMTYYEDTNEEPQGLDKTG